VAKKSGAGFSLRATSAPPGEAIETGALQKLKQMSSFLPETAA
jgi:hypothetical protein